jgi:hypothetical protein
MTAVVGSIALATALLGWPPSVASAQTYRIYGAEQYFTLDWEAGQYRGRPIVSGYLRNNYGLSAGNVRLLVESLDVAGQVASTTIGYVSGLVPSGGRVYFEVPLPAPAPAYRVNVLSWDWKFGPSGGLDRKRASLEVSP